MFLMVLSSTHLAKAPPPTCDDPEFERDEQLVAAAQANPHAFTCLYERYLERIYRFCYNRLGERQAAEDATSEVFLQALAHLPAYRSGTFAAWLYTIARNVVIAHYRRQRRNESLASRCQSDAVYDPLAAHAEYTDLLIVLEQLSDEPVSYTHL